ncbi:MULTISPECIES: Lrp/AsnC family transcriptional regulator [Mycolicibacterium]|uniref:Transcriptional regulator, AsnC family n=1 Tax=Mycolicibacterium gilvum (strain PYR-GCK) TaxID=350054 RepID=A4TCH9_MYCGI|nr:Lrp/AsnC family transcriptional regulator [Mycolicibacterium sp. PAM1]ABP46486.1 transcriptional regulator, AsnC family [Mycolicibacterium gilvum PYR-GCK]MBV5244608.1 Lrp/AsnC family transcriptional regulator [Mycolicibacterium sp. PAM1]
MSKESTTSRSSAGLAPKDVREVTLDDVDRRILTALHSDARMANSALAELVGIAPSTCHGRVRRLQELGVIRGFYADIDPAAIGLTLQAMISVSLQANSRSQIRHFIQTIRRKPQVMDVYFLAGADDFILHVAARDTEDLRAFVVENLNADADVAGTQTSLIFEHLRGASPL